MLLKKKKIKRNQQHSVLLKLPGRILSLFPCNGPTEVLRTQTSRFPSLEMTAPIRTRLHKPDEAKQKHFTAHSIPGSPSKRWQPREGNQTLWSRAESPSLHLPSSSFCTSGYQINTNCLEQALLFNISGDNGHILHRPCQCVLI